MKTSSKASSIKKKTRLILKSGNENIAVCVADIVVFDTRDRTVFVIDKYSNKYPIHKNLCEVYEDLDESVFFRANRQQIININYIKGFRVFEKVKLSVQLTLIHLPIQIIISQETAPLFKKWLCES
jgi:DNA-binding LytR/AlgR family response regulator